MEFENGVLFSGGGIYAYESKLILNRSNFTQNKAGNEVLRKYMDISSLGIFSICNYFQFFNCLYVA